MNDFIGPLESAFENKTIAVYRLLISHKTGMK